MRNYISKFLKPGLAAALALTIGASFAAGALAQVSSTRVGQLVYNPGNKTVYMVGASGLYGFPSAAVFYSWGYNFSQVSAANSAEASLALAGIVQTKQTGCNSPSDTCGNIAVTSGSSSSPRVGQLVYNPGNKTVFLVGSDGLHPFSSAAVFYSWNFTFNQIVPANSSESALPVAGLVPAMASGCGSPLNQIAGTCGSNPPVSGNPPVSAAPVISILTPSSGSVGTLVTITGTGFTSTGNTISLKNYLVAADVNSGDGRTLQFTVPSALSPNCPAGTACPQYVLNVTPGDYPVAVSNSNGASNPETFTVTGTVATPQCTYATAPSGYHYEGGQPYPACGAQLVQNSPASLTALAISILNPSSGSVGTLVTITGTGFTSSNTIKFDVYSFVNVASTNGTTLTFNVPSTLFYNNCPAGTMCPTTSRITVNGNYNVSVTNLNGTSNTQTFTVTGSGAALQ